MVGGEEGNACHRMHPAFTDLRCIEVCHTLTCASTTLHMPQRLFRPSQGEARQEQARVISHLLLHLSSLITPHHSVSRHSKSWKLAADATQKDGSACCFAIRAARHPNHQSSNDPDSPKGNRIQNITRARRPRHLL
jgi:hypothetical protein